MLPTIPYSHPDAPALMCTAKLLGNQTLHKEIREKGGAYGAGARYNPSLGFQIFTYRDPHLRKSLKAMDRAVEKVAQGDIEDRELEEAQLSVIQKLDIPVSPGDRAPTSYSRWVVGKHPEVRQQFRDHFLALTKEEVARVAAEHLAPQMEKAVVVSFAGQELLEGSGLEVLPV